MAKQEQHLDCLISTAAVSSSSWTSLGGGGLNKLLPVPEAEEGEEGDDTLALYFVFW